VSKKDRFHAAQFTPTKWSNAEDKAKFANWLAQFLTDGCPLGRWSVSKYRILCQMFGFIAHYDAGGFWENRFATPAARYSTVYQMLHQSSFGDPAHTWSDVERVIRVFILEERLEERYRGEHEKSVEEAEEAQLKALKAKYPDRR
jgi:hypothetical protein